MCRRGHHLFFRVVRTVGLGKVVEEVLIVGVRLAAIQAS